MAGVRIAQPESERIAELWRRLPHADAMLCHMPPYVVRFLQRDRRVAEFSVCWACNNAYGLAESAPAQFTFDAGSVVARELLAVLQRTVPTRTEPN
jgi:hypothetical protein